jgi:UDP-N-acetylglucosamine 2-epimerase
VDRLADVHWCPSQAALDSLIQEDVVKDTARSVVVGDVMLDVFREYEPLPHRDRGGMVVTIHRNTNVDDAANRKLWLDAVCRLAEDRVVIWPMHHRWWSVATSEERNQLRGSKVRLASPVGHEQMLKWCASAAVVVTDSGGLQKESYMLGTPVAILRKETEWQELLVSDGVELFDPLEPGVADRLVKWVEERERIPSNFPPVYGEGNAAKAMADHFVALWPKS